MNAIQTNVANMTPRLFAEGKGQSNDEDQMFATLLQSKLTPEKETVEAEEANQGQASLTADSHEDLAELLEEMMPLEQSTDVIIDNLVVLLGKMDISQESKDAIVKKIADMLEVDETIELQQVLQELALSSEEYHVVTEMLHIVTDDKNRIAPENAIRMEFSNLITEIQAVMQQLQEGQPKAEVASMLLPLLKTLSTLAKQMDDSTFQQMATKQLPKETLELIDKLVERYEKRQHFSTKKMYGTDAEVTSKDVARWISDILPKEQQMQTDRVIPLMNNDQFSTQRMSVVEQHVIHVNNGERVERVQQELTNQITNIVQQSKFGRPGNLLQELSIIMKPDHLGSMTIKLTQENNEIIVKIITASSMTKDLLEKNMHQLKHAFSPHQVQIVRDDTIIDEEVIATHEEETNSEEHEERDELNEQDNTEQETVDFAALFQQLQEEGDFTYD